MAEDSGKTKAERLSEKARRADALAAAKLLEKEIYEQVVENLEEFPELDSLYENAQLAEVQRHLLDRWEEALEQVESDRAAFREAAADKLEADWQLRQAVRGLAWNAGGWLAAAAGIAFAVRTSYSIHSLNSTAFLAVLGLFIAAAARNRSVRLTSALRVRRNANLDFAAAESLLENAIREVALPSQLRLTGQRRRRRRVEANTPPRQVGLEKALTSTSYALRIDPTNLVELYQSPQQLATTGRERLKALVGALGSASLGIAGPRGVGKTSLLEWFFDHQFTNAGHLAVRIPAPVRYEPRDFVLSAFAQVCEAVMGGRDVAVLPGRDRFFASTAAAILGFSSLVAGIVVYATNLTVGGSTRQLTGAVLMVVGSVLLTLRLSPMTRDSITPRYLSNNVIRDSSNPDEIAPQLFNEICFQLTFATGYSGKLTAGPGELAAETSYSVAARQESFPEVVARFRAFLETVAKQRGKLYIGIDELDKMQVKDAVRFLDDIKGLFGIANCFFLVCISEDALGQFERRGLPIRDAFDSAFDEVVRIEPLTAGESTALLDKRTEIDPALAAICHVLAGGLPRDVIRHARRLAIFTQSPVSIDEVAALLVHQDLQERARGMKVETKAQTPNEDESLWRLSSSPAPIPPAELIEIADALPAPLTSLGCLTLLGATLLELAALDLSILRKEANALAEVRRGSAVHPGRAREQCIALREKHSLAQTVIA